MNLRLALSTLLALSAASLTRADVTFARTTTITFSSIFPADIQAQVKQTIDTIAGKETVIRIKGDKVYSTFGPLAGISDHGSNQITLLNPKTKQYATGSLADYLDKVAATTQASSQGLAAPPPGVEQIFQSMKFDVQTKKTGQIGTIQGILAEESLTTLTMSMGLGGSVMPAMRMEMHIWAAPPEEVARASGLQELARNQNTFDRTGVLSKIFSQMPALGGQLRELSDKLAQANGNLMLKVTADVYVPILSQVMTQAGRAPAGVGPNDPVAQFQSDLTQLSTASIDDSVFAVPADYRSVSMEELIKTILPAFLPVKPASLQ